MYLKFMYPCLINNLRRYLLKQQHNVDPKCQVCPVRDVYVWGMG